MKKITTLFIFSLLLFTNIKAQENTVGLQYQTGNAYDGYTLFTPSNNNNVYLIDNCGEKVHQWEFTERPGLTCYLLENGNLLRAGKNSIEIRDWDNNVDWTFLMSKIGENQHHDIEPLPNGNVLCIAADIYSAQEMIGMGRDSLNVGAQFKLSKIIELQPIGDDSATVVWEWKFSDHLIQDFDSTKANYGNIQEHPELIDINFQNSENSDYTHLNSVDYNADLDEIMISARHLNEIYIIDHSTTTEEAAGHIGGNSGHGGDIIWRWGNPQVYKQGDSTNQKLFLQHDAKWIEAGYASEGKISVFNNGGDGSGTFSSVNIINPTITNNQYSMTNNTYDPIDFDWSWNGQVINHIVNESKKSSVQILPNNNFMICETSIGRISELSKTGECLWVYTNPDGDKIYNQFEVPELNDMFRADKYPADYAGFDGHSLNPTGLIENENSISDTCLANVSITKLDTETLNIVNPTVNGEIILNKNIDKIKITIYDIIGRIVFSKSDFSGMKIQTGLHSGTYVISLRYKGLIKREKLICR